MFQRCQNVVSIRSELLNDIKCKLLVRYIYSHLHLRFDSVEKDKFTAFLQPSPDDVLCGCSTDIHQSLGIECEKPEGLVPHVKEIHKTIKNKKPIRLTRQPSALVKQQRRVAKKLEQMLTVICTHFAIAMTRKRLFEKRCNGLKNTSRTRWLRAVHAIIKQNNVKLTVLRLNRGDVSSVLSGDSDKCYKNIDLAINTTSTTDTNFSTLDNILASAATTPRSPKSGLTGSADDITVHCRSPRNLAVTALAKDFNQSLANIALKPIDEFICTGVVVESPLTEYERLAALRARQNDLFIRQNLTGLDVKNLFHMGFSTADKTAKPLTKPPTHNSPQKGSFQLAPMTDTAGHLSSSQQSSPEQTQTQHRTHHSHGTLGWLSRQNSANNSTVSSACNSPQLSPIATPNTSMRKSGSNTNQMAPKRLVPLYLQNSGNSSSGSSSGSTISTGHHYVSKSCHASPNSSPKRERPNYGHSVHLR